VFEFPGSNVVLFFC